MPISQQALINSLLSRHESRKKYIKYAVLSMLGTSGYSVKEIDGELRNMGFDIGEKNLNETFSELWREKFVISVHLSGGTYFLRV